MRRVGYPLRLFWHSYPQVLSSNRGGKSYGYPNRKLAVRILFTGDIVGKPGVEIMLQALPGIRMEESIDLIIANGENSDAGSGINSTIYRKLIAAGVDCITLGDHIYRKKEIIPILEEKENIIKPANYPGDSPGRGWTVVKAANGVKVAVFSLMGRVFMRPVDCPYHCLLYTSPSPRDKRQSRMPSSA